MVFTNLFADFEKKEECQIIFACEAGSRAYGVSHEKSDYDIRLIYKKSIRTYLSLQPFKDSFSYKKDNLDVQGWDLRKALHLARKSNPSLFEMISSEHFYLKDDVFYNNMKKLIEDSYSMRVLANHYLQLANRNAKHFAENSSKIANLYHSLRAVLMVEYMLTKDELPPIQLSFLINQSEEFQHSELEDVITAKKDSIKLDTQFALELNSKILHYISEHKSKIEEIPIKKVKWDTLQTIFFEQIGFHDEV